MNRAIGIEVGITYSAGAWPENVWPPPLLLPAAVRFPFGAFRQCGGALSPDGGRYFFINLQLPKGLLLTRKGGAITLYSFQTDEVLLGQNRLHLRRGFAEAVVGPDGRGQEFICQILTGTERNKYG